MTMLLQGIEGYRWAVWPEVAEHVSPYLSSTEWCNISTKGVAFPLFKAVSVLQIQSLPWVCSIHSEPIMNKKSRAQLACFPCSLDKALWLTGPDNHAVNLHLEQLVNPNTCTLTHWVHQAPTQALDTSASLHCNGSVASPFVYWLREQPSFLCSVVTHKTRADIKS